MAGKAQQEEARLNAFQMQTQKKQNKTAALQQARARREEYDLATSANLAAFAARRGRNALYSSLFSAVGTVGEGYYKYKTVEV
jgi:hypothetical protein